MFMFIVLKLYSFYINTFRTGILMCIISKPGVHRGIVIAVRDKRRDVSLYLIRSLTYCKPWPVYSHTALGATDNAWMDFRTPVGGKKKVRNPYFSTVVIHGQLQCPNVHTVNRGQNVKITYIRLQYRTALSWTCKIFRQSLHKKISVISHRDFTGCRSSNHNDAGNMS